MPDKYCVLILDGAAGWPIKGRGNKTSLELAHTPNLDALARAGFVGLTNNVPPGMEPSSAIACMSLLGYNPEVYYRGRAAIEAVSMGIPIGPDEVVFRCNLVAVKGGRMWSYCAGHITDVEASELIASLNEKMGDETVHFYPGVGYRHLLKLKGHGETIQAACTPPHDIPDQPIAAYLPQGLDGKFLRQLMAGAGELLKDHPVNLRRIGRGEIPATMVWLFWGSGQIPPTPSFQEVYGLKAAITSGVDLLRGLGQMTGMTILNIPGVTDNMQNDFIAQVDGALAALKMHDLAVIHVEAPDEAGHAGNLEEKVAAIEKTDELVVSRLRNWPHLKIMIMPDHPTPVSAKTHVAEPVPCLMLGGGLAPNHAGRFTEAEAAKSGYLEKTGYNMMKKFVTF